ncbi:MAG: hypothetical protein DMF49_05650, partial [Acidobacteria bacterium]
MEPSVWTCGARPRPRSARIEGIKEDPPDSERLVAIIGLGAVLPKARNAQEFWDNVLAGRDCISEVPKQRWDPEAFFDPDREAEDKTYCKVGGFVEEIPFDSRAFKIPPRTAQAMDRVQKMALVAAVEALHDAGYDKRPFDRTRTAVILGNSLNHTEVGLGYRLRLQLPFFEAATRRTLEAAGVSSARIDPLLKQLRESLQKDYLPFTEDSFPGFLVNVAAGRIANHLDLHGASYVVDSACASTLAAIDCALEGLVAREFDLALAGGCQAMLGPHIFVLFSKFRGLSSGRVSPFDAGADGFLLGEGAGLFVLKRLADALRDGDRIYAVIRGIGSSSDGCENGIEAPSLKAEALAIERAYETAGYSPGTVQFVETYGAGTPVGDPTEIRSMLEAFGPHLHNGRRIAIGAVKSQVGHLMGASGAAGLLKTVLAMHHKVIPPTVHHDRPSPAIPWNMVPFDVVTSSSPWPANAGGLPRRAGVSSFGFGGTNFHAALEEYDERFYGRARGKAQRQAPATAEGVERPEPGEPIAVVGIGALFPGAPRKQAFWENMLGKVDVIAQVPPERWEGHPEALYDPDPEAEDKIYTRMGACIATPEFDGRRFRIGPEAERHLDPEQKILLEAAFMALQDAGYDSRPFDRGRTAVIIGNVVGSDESMWNLSMRITAQTVQHRLLSLDTFRSLDLDERTLDEILLSVRREMLRGRLPITEETFPSVCGQMGAARLAKTFDLMGTHMTVDAACASSLASVGVAVQGLRSGKWDMALTGGVARANGPLSFALMSKCRALSATGSRPFDRDADGVVFGEGAAIFVLKRLRDALADKDRIYAVIRGVGMSSDGRGHSMTAPDAAGQTLAMRRAYEDAGYDPASVQLVECHATSTPVGDRVEVEALRRLFPPGAAGHQIGIGSVKSQIGHTLGAAGAAGLLKAALGLHHKIVPPTINVREVNPELHLEDSPFYLVTEPGPWPANRDGDPRRGSVSAFGFGGTNVHVTLEEFSPEYHARLVQPMPERYEPALAGCEMVAIGAGDPDALRAGARQLAAKARAAAAEGIDLAGFARETAPNSVAAPCRLALTAGSLEDLAAKLDLAASGLQPGRRSPVLEAKGIYAGEGPAGARGGKVVFLFPGQGGQYADMLRDLHERYPVVRETFAEANEILAGLLGAPLQELIFTGAGRGQVEEVEQRLMRSDLVQPAILTVSISLLRLLRSFGIEPDLLAGHSLGEYAALVAAGCLEFGQALSAVHVRGLEFRRLAEREGDPGRMAMVSAAADDVECILREVGGYVTIANRNCNFQTIISGATGAVEEAVLGLEREGIECRILPIAGAFHSTIARAISAPMAEALSRLEVRPPRIPVHSSVDGRAYPADGSCHERVLTNLIEQLERPVDFIGLVERLYGEGARAFIEVGPKRALSTFVSDILEGRAHAALYTNHPKEGGTTQFNRLLAQLAAMGFEIGGAARSPAVEADLRPGDRSEGVKQEEAVRSGDSQEPIAARSSDPPHPRRG